MNNLFLSQCYLAGSMDRNPDGGIFWRERIVPILHDMGIIVLNPCDKPIKGYDETPHISKMRHIWKENQDYDKFRECRYIRNCDLRMVDRADFLIVHFNIEHGPCGSLEELGWANRSKKPILMWNELGKHTTPDWIFWMIDHEWIFDTLEQLINHLHLVNEGKIHHKRWMHFDIESQVRLILDKKDANIVKKS